MSNAIDERSMRDLLVLSNCSCGFLETSECLSLVSSNALRRKLCMLGRSPLVAIDWGSGDLPDGELPAAHFISSQRLGNTSHWPRSFEHSQLCVDYVQSWIKRHKLSAKDAIQLISHVLREAYYLRCATIVIPPLLA